MTEKTRSTPQNSQGEEIEEYSPSWFDHLTRRVRKLQWPSWLSYVSFSISVYVIGFIVFTLVGEDREILFQPITFLILVQLTYVLSLIDFLDRRAKQALSTMKPILKASEATYKKLNFLLTSLPSKQITRVSIGTIIVMLLMGIALFGGAGDQVPENLFSPGVAVFSNSFSGYFGFLFFSVLWLVNIIFIYHTFHQLKAIDHIVINYVKVNLFRQTELHSFSKLSASTAIGLVLTSPIWLIVDRGIFTLIINIVFSLIAIIIFVSPLLGTRRLLREQKERLLIESMERKEELILITLSKLREGDFNQLSHLDEALSALEKTHQSIEGISTWPWDLETFRRFSGALFLPITIWIIQYLLTRFFEV